MSTSKRAESALSSSSNDLIDQQLNELISATENRPPVSDKGNTGVEGEAENVAVMVRCRPLSGSGNVTAANKTKYEAPVKADEEKKCVLAEGRQFFYDQVFGPESDNEQVYMRSARRLVDCAFRGYNCAIFLYGQTGTGKTYTHASLTLSAFEHLFGLIQDSNKGARFLIRASYYELYNEEIRDLLAPKGAGGKGRTMSASLELRESKERGVYVKNLTCFLVNNLAELKRLKQLGDKRRTTAATRMNEHSSRSHSIFSVTIETVSCSLNGPADDSTASTSARAKRPGGRHAPAKQQHQQQPVIRVGHLNLVDLAGSERQSKSGASGLALKEASRINLSLTCLSLVIRALTDRRTSGPTAHIPYRNSKLTRLLSSSLGGNSKTLLIACVSLDRSNLDETLNTLRFASRTKQIKNRAVINEDPKDALLRKYRQQLEELRMKLNQHQQLQAADLSSNDASNARIDEGNYLNEVARHQDDQDQTQLKKQLELLKAKIMFGGENLLDKLELHERLLEASRNELEERRREEAKLRERLQSKSQTIEQVVQSKGSLESQLEYLEAKLEKAIDLYRSSKLELRDLSGEHEQLKGQLLQTIRATSKEIKYVDCINEDFVPREQLYLINAYAQYDDESDEWQIKYIALSGNNIVQTRRLVAGDPTVAEQASGRQLLRRDRRSSAGRQQQRRRRMVSAGDRPDPFLRLL